MDEFERQTDKDTIDHSGIMMLDIKANSIHIG